MSDITRPNGKPYRARKIVAYPVTSDGDELMTGVVVFGTHDPGRAGALAQELVRRDYDSGCKAVDPQAVWWRDGFECGQRRFVTDEVRGRAGVWFREIVEVPDE